VKIFTQEFEEINCFYNIFIILLDIFIILMYDVIMIKGKQKQKGEQ